MIDKFEKWQLWPKDVITQIFQRPYIFISILVVGQRDHFIEGHRVRVELALPLINDSLYEKDIVVPGETWIEKVQRKLQYAIPDHGTWGETLDNYAIFVQGGPDVKTIQFKIPRGMLGMFFIRLKI